MSATKKVGNALSTAGSILGGALGGAIGGGAIGGAPGQTITVAGSGSGPFSAAGMSPGARHPQEINCSDCDGTGFYFTRVSIKEKFVSKHLVCRICAEEGIPPVPETEWKNEEWLKNWNDRYGELTKTEQPVERDENSALDMLPKYNQIFPDNKMINIISDDGTT